MIAINRNMTETTAIMMMFQLMLLLSSALSIFPGGLEGGSSFGVLFCLGPTPGDGSCGGRLGCIVTGMVVVVVVDVVTPDVVTLQRKMRVD